MSNDVGKYRFSPVSEAAHERIEQFTKEFLAIGCPTDGVKMRHDLHAGCYVRTAFVPAGYVLTTEKIQCDTVVIVNGDCIFTDTEKAARISGYKVLLGARGRQSLIRTLSDTYITMIFATKAKTVAEAESEFSDTPDRLLKFGELTQ